MRMSRAEYNALQARTLRHQVTSSAGVDSESKLHAEILEECNRRNWIVFHGSMAHRTYRTPGEPDFVILADGGATILVEAKTRKGKLSTEQLGVQAWAKKLEHTVHVVRSMADFQTILEHGRMMR